MIKACEAREMTKSYQMEMDILGTDKAHEILSSIEAVIKRHAEEGKSLCDVFIFRLFDPADIIARNSYLKEIKRVLFANGFDVIFNAESKILRIQW